MKYWIIVFFGLILCVWGCDSDSSTGNISTPIRSNATEGNGSKSDDAPTWKVDLRVLNDEEYPDNPDISIRHASHDQYAYKEIQFTRQSDGLFEIELHPTEDAKKTTPVIYFSDINLIEWMPTAPKKVLSDPFLTKVTLQNQEFNRHQVKFLASEFMAKKPRKGALTPDRIDLARNCLNAGLWEVIFFQKEPNKGFQPGYHAWFDFPEDLYAMLFKERNALDYADFKHILKDWQDLPAQKIDFSLLREVTSERPIPFTEPAGESYPVVGERKKKAQNIIAPAGSYDIQGFQTDAAVFATFSPPGFYSRAESKSTQLGRFAYVKSVVLRDVQSGEKSGLVELAFTFTHAKTGELTHYTVGGFNLEDLPTLPLANMHKGWQMPVGVANHSFYESYQFQQENPATESTYYALLTDASGGFVDSHNAGIDGQLMYLDAENPQKLHFWLLSFERHAFVGHFILDIGPVEVTA